MLSLANFRISIRLIAAFSLVLALTAAIGLAGIYSASDLADITTAFHDHPFTIVDNIGQARVALRDARLAARNMILSEAPEAAAAERQLAADDIAKATKFLEAAKSAFPGDTSAP